MDQTPRATTTRDGDRVTVRISGYLSAAAEEALAAAFAQAVDAPQVLVAFAPDSFLNSAGIAVLLAHVLPLKDQGKDVRLVHPAAHFRRVFQIVGLTQDVPVFAGETEALAGA
jgi:anti-anti-sigma factor